MKKEQISYKDVLGYEPSEYQIRIFDFVTTGHGNAVIKARAGCAKTSTMITSMKLVDYKKKCIFLAFNKSVQQEIEEKLSGYDNCTVKTVHGLGYDILKLYLEKEPEVNDYKYRDYLRKHISELCSAKLPRGNKAYDEYFDTIIQLLEFARLNLAQSIREIKQVSDDYSIPVKYDECDVVKSLMDWGKTEPSIIDYTDMVWLPNELSINAYGNRYDWIFNDEAQDYAIAYVKLFLKCFKRGTRFLSCGDEYQSINAFAGASEKAFNEMINYRNTSVFILPISYRCDKAIVQEANRFVTDIYPRPDAGLGLVKLDTDLSYIKGNDMVLCRTNAPLFKMYSKLIKRGVPCYIKGKENDKEKLLSVISRYSNSNDLGKDLKSDGLFPRLYDSMITERNRLVESGMDVNDAIYSEIVQSKYDTIVSLLTLASDCNTVEDLSNKIEKIYKKTNDGVCLSTIHKAKGLESDTVHIICRSEMPQKSAKTKRDIQQEMNLIYVAITRARHTLCYVSEKVFPPTKAFDNGEDTISEFNYIESMICTLYNKPTLNPIRNAEIAKFRLSNATVIDSSHKDDNKKALGGQKQPLKGHKSNLLDNLL